MAFFLLGNTAWAERQPVLGQLVAEIRAVVQDPATQWLVALCLASYLAVFTVLRRRFARDRFQAGVTAEKWLLLGLLWAALRYGVDYPAQPLGTGFLVLLAGATMAQGVAAWLAWRGEEAVVAQRRLLAWLVLLLAAGACWHPAGGMQFEYRGGARWSGPWENPNQFGLLMGTGLVLAVGLFQCGRRNGEGGIGSAESGKAGRMERPSVSAIRRLAVSPLLRFGWLVVAGVMGYALLRSYSRGAWLGTALGLACLAVAAVWRPPHSSVGAESNWRRSPDRRYGSRVAAFVREHRGAWVVLAVSLAVIGFWPLQRAEWRPARRVASVGNVNDFSWRNRVAAWEGALVMIGDRPWFGWGWGVPEQVYGPLYLAERSEEGLAIQLNDYLMLAMSAGLPALVGFVGFVALSLRGGRREGLKGGLADSPARRFAVSPAQVCRAGVVVLLVGFCFDGGLFKLPAATVFWVLLGMAGWGMTNDNCRMTKE